MKTLALLFLASQLTNPPSDYGHPAADSVKINNVRLEDGLIAYYPFNGNANDASGHKNNGFILDDGMLTYDEHGKANSALGGNGDGGRVIVSNNGNFAIDSAFSVSFTVSIKRYSRQLFVAVVDNSSGKGAGFGIGTSVPNDKDLVFGLVDNTADCDNYNNNRNSHSVISQFVPQPGSWYQVTCTFNRGIAKVFVNGKMVSMQSFREKAIHICPNAQLIIGGWWQKDPQASLVGVMDEVRIYNREVNGDEVAELAKNFLE